MTDEQLVKLILKVRGDDGKYTAEYIKRWGRKDLPPSFFGPSVEEQCRECVEASKPWRELWPEKAELYDSGILL